MSTSIVSQTIAQFDELSFAGQATVIWQQGQPLATRHIPGFRVHLYSVGSFCVELWICRRRLVVTLIRALRDTDDLMAYVETCSLTDLLVTG